MLSNLRLFLLLFVLCLMSLFWLFLLFVFVFRFLVFRFLMFMFFSWRMVISCFFWLVLRWFVLGRLLVDWLGFFLLGFAVGFFMVDLLFGNFNVLDMCWFVLIFMRLFVGNRDRKSVV